MFILKDISLNLKDEMILKRIRSKFMFLLLVSIFFYFSSFLTLFFIYQKVIPAFSNILFLILSILMFICSFIISYFAVGLSIQTKLFITDKRFIYYNSLKRKIFSIPRNVINSIKINNVYLPKTSIDLYFINIFFYYKNIYYSDSVLLINLKSKDYEYLLDLCDEYNYKAIDEISIAEIKPYMTYGLIITDILHIVIFISFLILIVLLFL